MNRHSSRLRLAAALAAAILVVSPAAAQDDRARFEVASVKRNTSGPFGGTAQVLPNGVNLTNQALRNIIRLAHAINHPSGLIGPEWIDSARFDVVARTATAVPSGELRPMLQALLSERFDLAFHIEKRTLPAFALVLARTDRQLGPQLTRSTAGCAAARAGGPAPQTVMCGPRPGQGLGRLSLVGSPVSQLAGLLSLAMGQAVRDRTGLTGRYDVDLTFAPVRAPESLLDPALLDRPSLFTAVQEQLGLALEPIEEEVDVLVIDRVESPTEN